MYKTFVNKPLNSCEDPLEQHLQVWELHSRTNISPPINAIEYLKKDALTEGYTNALSTHLRILGLNPKLAGHRCLLAVIPMFHANPGLTMKEALPEVAKICDLPNEACVEHAIRTAIHNAWLNCNISVWAHYFPINRTGDISRPTSKEFIFAILQKM